MSNNLKERHGCITGWLYFAIIENAFVGASYISKFGDIGWSAAVMVAASVIIIYSCILLMQWRKIGFYLLLACTLISVPTTIITDGFNFSSLFGLLAILVWFAILQIKNSKGQKCWDLLK